MTSQEDISRVCACAGACVCGCMRSRVRARVRACVCVCVRARVCVCVCHKEASRLIQKEPPSPYACAHACVPLPSRV